MTAVARPMPMPAPRIAGVAGGVGTSTVARLLGAIDAGVWTGEPVDVLVCRSTAGSTAAATVAVAGVSDAARAAPPVLVVVADGPWAMPAGVRARLRMLDPYVAAVRHLPYVGRWRELTDPLAADAPPPPKRFQSAARAVVEAITMRHAARAGQAADWLASPATDQVGGVAAANANSNSNANGAAGALLGRVATRHPSPISKG